MTDSDIDAAVLSCMQTRWQKVAMVMCNAAEKLHGNLRGGDEAFEPIAARIQILVENRRLEAQGDITHPRFSEIRLPRENTPA